MSGDGGAAAGSGARGPPAGGFPEGGPIYLNNASASPMPSEAVEAVSGFLAEYGRAGPDSAEAGRLVSGTLRDVRRLVAGIIRCSPEEISLNQSTTDGVNAVAGGIRIPRGSSVVVRGMGHEHHANYYPWMRLAGRARVRSLDIDADGLFDMRQLERMLDGGGVRLAALSHALYNTGAILPAEEAGEALERRGIPYFLDAAQTVGCTGRLDVSALRCDFMAFNGSKWLCGPMGTGLLYCRKGSAGLLEPRAVGGESATLDAWNRVRHRDPPERFEAGFRNYAGMAGLAAAIRRLLRYGLDAARDRAMGLAAQLREDLSAMPGVTVHGPDDEGMRTSIVPFSVRGRDPRELAARLEARGVVMAVREMGEARMVRASPHYFNTESQVERAAEEVRREL